MWWMTWRAPAHYVVDDVSPHIPATLPEAPTLCPPPTPRRSPQFCTSLAGPKICCPVLYPGAECRSRGCAPAQLVRPGIARIRAVTTHHAKPLTMGIVTTSERSLHFTLHLSPWAVPRECDRFTSRETHRYLSLWAVYHVSATASPHAIPLTMGIVPRESDSFT